MLQAIAIGLAIVYAAILCFFSLGIRRERRRNAPAAATMLTVSVLVPARNEAEHICQTLESLRCQDYPRELFEVIVIDDRSTDGTAAVVNNFIGEHQPNNIRLLPYGGIPGKVTYKKNAVAHAIEHCQGSLIITTDADCQVQPGWIRSMVSRFGESTGMVAGLVTFGPAHETNLFHKLQTLEFAGLVFCGVGAIGNGFPIICNGSNLSYRRQSYQDINGFAGHEDIPSGDDDLFMQHLHRHSSWRVRYNLDPQSINFTQPLHTLPAFLNQRARWGSKSLNYPGTAILLILLSIYLFYLILLLSPLWIVLSLISWKGLAVIWALKILPELSIIIQGLAILGRRELLRFYPLALFVQIPYIVAAGFAGFFNLFSWKKHL